MRKIAINLETQKRNASRSLPVNGIKNYPSYKLVHWQNNFRNQRCLSRENQG